MSGRRPYKRWTPEELALFATHTDREIAALTGRRAETVHVARLRNGPEGSWKHRRKWTDEDRAMLGVLPDREVAERTGRTADSVRNSRIKFGIYRVGPRPAPAEGPGTGKRIRWTPELLDELGKVPDRELAARLGLDASSVRRKRIRAGIAMGPGVGGQKKFGWTPALLSRLGAESDRAIARDAGISQATVRCKRVALGIPAFRTGSHAADAE